MHEQQWQLGRHVRVHTQRRQHHPQAVERTADDVRRGHPVAGQLEAAMAQAGHVQQVLDVAIEAFGLVAGALQQLATVFGRDRVAQRQQAVDAATHGGQRRAQVMGYGSQQGAAQLLGFAVQACGFQLFGQACAGQGLGQGLA
ncbi:hypothetical protein D3C80_1370020 [compost metagenome]